MNFYPLMFAVSAIFAAGGDLPSIKGAKLGETVEEFQADHPGATNTANLNRYFRFTDTIGGVGAEFLAAFEDGRLETLGISEIDANEFKSAIAPIFQKYGKPTFDEKFTMTTRMGARFTARKITWGSESKGWWIQATERTDNNVFKSRIDMTTTGAMHRFEAEQRKKQKDDI